MNPLYNLALRVYQAGIYAAAKRNPKAAQMVAGYAQVFSYIAHNRQDSDRYVWFHAASLGEFEQGRPVIEALRAQHPELKIALTFFSPSGYEVRKNYEGADLICYLPIDTPANAKRFLDLLRPEKAFFIKYEFWANYLTELKSREVPIYLFSAIFRPQQVFFKPYGRFFRRLLTSYTEIFVQDDDSQNLLAQYDVASTVAGDTRFDRVLQIQAQAKSLPQIASMLQPSDFTIVAGSTWPADERILIEFFNQTPGCKLIIAPHEIHEDHITGILSQLKRPYKRFTQLKEGELLDHTTDCLVIDCIGLLSSIYQFGQVAYIGGGFGVGIHNTLEAAVYSIPVLFGPKYTRFREACQLIDCQGAVSIEQGQALEAQLNAWMQQPAQRIAAGQAAGHYVAQQAGATAQILKSVWK